MPERGSGGPTGPRTRVGQPSRRAKTLLITAGVLAVLAMLFVMFAGFWTDWLWYRSVDYTNVFTTQLWTKVGLFAVFGLFMALAVGFNIWLAHRLRPPLSAMSMEQQSLDRYRMGIAPYRKWLLLGVTALIGLIAGASASGQWRTWLMWVNGTPFGQTDAQFGKDISFFTFELPFFRFLLSFGFAATVLSLIAAALVHYLYGGLRVTTPGARATAQATGHLSVLLGVFVALKAVAYWLDRYGLAVKSSDIRGQEEWTGLRFTDANAYLPAKTILFFIAIICTLLFFAALWRRTWQLPVIGLGLLVLSAILIGGLYPALVERFQVQPNQQAKETPYIAKNIDATRKAYGIDDAEITNYEGAGDEEEDGEQPPEEVLQAARDSVNDAASIRLLDPNVVSPAFRQTQQVRGYYTFPDNLDVDRYADPEGVERDTVIGLREINIEGVPERNWINDHFKYTHGYGVVSALGTEVDYEEGGGTPVFTESDLPPQGTLGEYQPRVYYGEETTRYSIVGGPQQELDYVANDEEKLYTYEGDSGVDISGTVNRAAYALAFGEPKILYSGAIGDGSRILYNRTPKERVEAVAPWLTIDGDPYPAVVDGKIQWIVDAYTTSNGYPYSSRTTLGDTTQDALTDGQRAVLAQQDQVNYIRNSVKATVDAYTGDVQLYQWDTQDPVLKTWMKAFPGTVEPRSEISDALLDHLRYPQDLFKVQRELLTRYHVTNPGQFYSGSERWEIPADPTSADEEPVPPYYLSLRMPEQEEKSFSLTTTFTPNNRQTLGAFMAVESDATKEDYGTIRLLNVPASNSVSGPQQVQSRFNSDTRIAESINLLERGDSEVEYGNLLTIPLQEGMLYIEPLYVRGADTNYPRMRKVLASYQGEIAYEDTLEQALNVVFQVEESEDPPPGDPPADEQDPPADQPEEEQDTPPGDLQELEDALQDAQDALDQLQDALRRAGEAQTDGGEGE
ncbi:MULTISPECIES: UPF0182 family membrane protein [Streptomyces]|uniref:UPF0182 family membrane protein n=1 Tax=Streptomyces TaxID=1883 RepID=UPI0022487ABB|nr:UPF0182 family protein [Streptomyces sp. JHD 1]MCX2969618.1 UPF0182 family protein [Streptomyces sp. JHD 1]